MYGHQLINNDTKKISYDFPVKAPFIGEMVLEKKNLEEALKKMKSKGADSIKLPTPQLDGIRFRDLDFADLKDVIDRMELVVSDLKEIKEQIK